MDTKLKLETETLIQISNSMNRVREAIAEVEKTLATEGGPVSYDFWLGSAKDAYADRIKELGRATTSFSNRWGNSINALILSLDAYTETENLNAQKNSALPTDDIF